MVRSLVADHLARKSCAAYFYCEYEARSSQTETTVAECLLRQLLETTAAIPHAVEYLYKTLGYRKLRLKLDDITDLLFQFCTNNPRVYILIDALDECVPSSRRRKVLSLLRRLSNAGAKVFVTSRLQVADIRPLSDDPVELEFKSNPLDIRSYVENMATDIIDQFGASEGDLKEEVVRRVTEQADGM